MKRCLVLSLAFCLTLLSAPNNSHAQGSASNAEDSILDMLPAILSGIKVLPRKINFKVALPSLGPRNQYVIELGRWDIPSNRSNPVKPTDNLQAAIDWATNQGFNKIVIPNGHFLVGKFGNAIYQRGIELDSNIELVLSPSTILEMGQNDKWNYCVIAINGKENVTVRGGTIKGDKATHIFTPRRGGGTAHDEGHGICTNSAKRILIENMRINNLTGDGVLIVGNKDTINSTDITIRNNNISHNRRQGVSVVGGVRVKIENHR